MEFDAKFVKEQKEKARLLRSSRWWQTKIANASCYYCQKPLTKSEATMDHVVPIRSGGTSSKGNVVVSCKDCNNKKQDLSIFEWHDYLEKLKSSK
jgi:5-methylcytosine-specific restriction protein A